MTTLRARFDGRVLIPEGSVNLPMGQILELQVVGATDVHAPTEDAVGELRSAMTAPPRLEEADLHALDQAIESGRLPVDQLGAFDRE